MQDNDYNIIKPVENMQNIGAMRPIDKQAEKGRRQNQQGKRKRATSHQDSTDAQLDETTWSDNDQSETSIDYRA